jgi:sucrose phosphorylase
VGRDINRHHYSRAEIDAHLQRPVVQQLLQLIRLRNSHPAFGGQFSQGATAPHQLDLGWSHGGASLQLLVDLRARTARITGSGVAGTLAWPLAGAVADSASIVCV